MKKKGLDLIEEQEAGCQDCDPETCACALAPVVYVPARLVRQQGNALLVEYWDAGLLKRVIVPAASYSDDKTVNWDDLQAGIPYGLPFEEIVNPTVAPEEIANALHKAGFWTSEDLKKDMRGLVAVFQSVYGIEAASLIQAAELFVRNEVKND